jgi:hypothetical protein
MTQTTNGSKEELAAREEIGDQVAGSTPRLCDCVVEAATKLLYI